MVKKRPHFSSPVQYLMGIKARQCTTEAFLFIQLDSMSLFILKYDMSVETLFSTIAYRKFYTYRTAVVNLCFLTNAQFYNCFNADI